MKKIILAGLFVISILSLTAQDIKTIKTALQKNDLANAKTQIDAFVDKNATNPEGWYLKSKVYNAIAANAQMSATVPNARMTAFESFKKAMDNAKGNKEFTLLTVIDKEFYKPLFDVYTGYYESGASYFNTAAAKGNKADFEQSLNEFKNADLVGHYIYENKWALSEIDTILILNIGKAALNAGKKAEATEYFKKLADANIKGTKDGFTGFDLPYQWLTIYYKDNKDEPNLLKYSALGKKYFPQDDYYDAVLLDHYREKKDYDALFKKYDEIVTKNPDSVKYRFNYANDAFGYIYNSDAGTKIANKDAILKTVGEQLQKAISLNPNDVNTNWLYGQYYYNSGVDLKEQANAVKGTKPEDVKKKAGLNAEAKDLFNKAIPFVDKALATLETSNKKSDKSRYKSIADLMTRIYQGLQQSDKVKLYQAKYDAADAKFIN